MKFLKAIIAMITIYPSIILPSSPTPSKKSSGPRVAVTINSSNNNAPNNTIETNQTTSQQVKHSHVHVVKLELPAYKLPTIPHDFQNHFQNYYNELWNYKWPALAASVVAAYAYINVRLYRINKLLENPKSWCLWKEEIPLNRLTTIDAHELLEQLKLDVYKKYFNIVDTLKDSALLLKFLENIAQEKELLEFYQSVDDVSKTCYVSKLFATYKTSEQITQYIARLDFLQDLYLHGYIQEHKNQPNN